MLVNDLRSSGSSMFTNARLLESNRQSVARGLVQESKGVPIALSLPSNWLRSVMPPIPDLFYRYQQNLQEFFDGAAISSPSSVSAGAHLNCRRAQRARRPPGRPGASFQVARRAS
jgi:hypothetical protein